MADARARGPNRSRAAASDVLLDRLDHDGPVSFRAFNPGSQDSESRGPQFRFDFVGQPEVPCGPPAPQGASAYGVVSFDHGPGYGPAHRVDEEVPALLQNAMGLGKESQSTVANDAMQTATFFNVSLPASSHNMLEHRLALFAAACHGLAHWKSPLHARIRPTRQRFL
jgi:hypothetical protein